MQENLSGLSFDDVFIRPLRTDVDPTEVSLASEVFRGHVAQLPLVASPMHTVFSPSLAKKLARFSVPSPIPRMEHSQLQATLTTVDWKPLVVAVSPFEDAAVREALDTENVDYVLLDTVVGHHQNIFRLLDSLSTSDLARVIVGNIATAEAASDLLPYHPAAVRVGIGAGSICTTAVVTGVGVPQLQAISEVSSVLRNTNIKIISCGGIRSAGDIAKAIAAGAHSVMMGKAFASTTEAAGHVKDIDGVSYKWYEGMHYSSLEFNNQCSGGGLDASLENLHHREHHRTEGVSGFVRHTGPVDTLLEYLSRCLSASLAFVGARDIPEFQSKAVLQRMSPAAYGHSRSHGIDQIVKRDVIMQG
jgi:IMP dehydrogenase